MKIKLFLIVICLFNLFSCSLKKECVLLGERILVDGYEFVDVIEKHTDKKYNDAFFISNFHIKSFYDQLNKEAIDLKSNKKISSLLINADDIIINIGNYEFLRFVNYEYGMFDYDENIIKENVELFGEYLSLTLESVLSYNDNITIISPFPYLILNSDLDNIYLKLIETYMTMIDIICNEYDIKNVKTIKTQKYLTKNKVLNINGVKNLIQMVYYD